LLNSGAYLTKSLHALFFKWFEYLFIFLVVEDVMNTPKRVRNAVSALLISGALIGLDAVFQKSAGFDLLRHRELIVGRVTATFKVTNVLAAYLIPVILLAIAPLFSGRIKRRYKNLFFFLSLLLTLVLISTFSRAGWLGFIAALALLLFLSRNLKRASVPLFLFLLVLLAVPSLRDRVTAHGDAQRIRLFSATAEMIKENPLLGKGVGTYMDHFSRKYPDKNPAYAHNSYMQVWAETGIFSFLSFIAFLAILVLKSARAVLRNQDFIFLGLVCGIFGFLIHSFFDNHFYSLQLSFLFWVLAGLCNSQYTFLTYGEQKEVLYFRSSELQKV
jgi:O-antigen ligase